MFGTYARNIIAGQGRYRPAAEKGEQPAWNIKLQHCEYQKEKKQLLLSSSHLGGKFPRELFITSHHTQKIVRFTVIGPEDILFDEDQWDGEQQIYRPVGNVPGVDHLVIHNAY